MDTSFNQLTDLLAIPSTKRRKVTEPADLEVFVERGLSSKALHHVHQALSMTVEEFSPVLGISARGFYGMLKRDRVDMTVSDRLYRVAQVIAAATTGLGSRPKAIEWMRTPLPALGGATPLSKLRTEIGTARVHEVLTAIEHGVYV